MEQNPTELTFEDFGRQNGTKHWLASEIMLMLGYKDMKSFQKVLDRTTKALISLGISHYDNIIAINRENGECDFKLTRFACYLTAMNANPKIPQVAMMQAYFVTQTRKFELYIQDNQEIERTIIRDELSEGYKSLNSVAKHHGLENYAKFQNAGYLGMYNMESWRLEKRRGVEHGHLADYMSRTELAANLFRITQTEERIKNKNITGQCNLEQTHYDVGREVRNIVNNNMGTLPENLPQKKIIDDVKKELKKGYKKMLKEESKNDNLI
jgi:DNA-damage-inducible protein D